MSETKPEEPEDHETFYDECNGRRITYEHVRKTMNGQPFPMSLVGTERLFVAKAINQGIDSHLEAAFVPARGDTTSAPTVEIARLDDQAVHGFHRHTLPYRLELSITPVSMPVLLRRLCEFDYEVEASGDSPACLASDILDIIEREPDDD